ncbi:23S rRNA (adenine(2503)-C(2))-methyltransferase RlmN [Paraconexibacter antarcticus]|uniref:Probable dual-specificity RNA methyltransferase RlmN n=1 Tax=Paraconexibacter antarcticus TaxID=2949664 RepID=A0ABY5DNC0_9ACTN|nr:23S rRNA (adenine(2503)-C(2))-methyltransferase RlmN [Paraconexibacter antarcticus]UTI63146.1 23S rRNA (adenine(2503)-C(2))-methyltransferase RlmN [Paraconexibacter antarcticus]
MDLALLDSTLADLGQPAFRARQVWTWTARGAESYDEMTDLPAAVRRELTERVPFSTLEVERESRSQDGTLKVLLSTHDNRKIEAVLMRYKDGRGSVCLSSQVGCALTCTFCATGRMKFARNLTAGEILDQALYFRRRADVTNAIFMGMGEPMMNLDHVLAAARRLPDIGISHRHTAISTVGWIPGIDRLTETKEPIRLALSLHAADEDLRSAIMPVNDRYPLADVLAACARFYAVKKRQVFVEYVMLEGINDQPHHAKELAAVLDPKVYKVNLIPYNPTDSIYDGSSREAIAAFRDVLVAKGIGATIRLTRGQDIDAACGQLAVKAGAV